MDVGRQVQYWQEMAEYDMATAGLLVGQKRFLPGLFFCHLAIEKILKAHIVKETTEHPPRTHNLTLLLTKTNLLLPPPGEAFLGVLMVYQIEGRYPAFYPVAPSQSEVDAIFEKTKTMLSWLKEKL